MLRAAAKFPLSKGRLIGPADLIDDPAYDRARRKAAQIADYMRAHGPFEPHRLPIEEMEYTTLPNVIKNSQDASRIRNKRYTTLTRFGDYHRGAGS